MDTQHYLTMLLEELADIERQLEDKTLPHSDQHLLNQAWERINDQIERIEAGEEDPGAEDVPWRDAQEYLDEEDERDDPEEFFRRLNRPQPLQVAPPPPSPDRLRELMRAADLASPPPPSESRWCRSVFADTTPLRWAPPLPDYEEDDYVSEDTRGCSHCPGCMYCETEVYDPAGEI